MCVEAQVLGGVVCCIPACSLMHLIRTQTVETSEGERSGCLMHMYFNFGLPHLISSLPTSLPEKYRLLERESHTLQAAWALTTMCS